MAKSNEPIWWSLFAAGGMVSALLVPIHLFLFGLAWPLGILPAGALEYAHMQSLLSNPLVQLYCFGLISLCLFHGAHRMRFTLVDLGLRSLNTLLAILFYGGAIAGTVATALILWA